MVDGEEPPSVTNAEVTSEEVTGAEAPCVTSEEIPSANTLTEDQANHEDTANTPPFLPSANSTGCQKQKRLQSVSPQSPPLRKKLLQDVFGNTSQSPKSPSLSPSPSPSTPLSPSLDIESLRKKFHLEFGMPWIGVSYLFIYSICILIFSLRPLQLLMRVQPQTTRTVDLLSGRVGGFEEGIGIKIDILYFLF